MRIKSEIFKEYDIRGGYPKEINEDVVYKIAQGFVKFFKLKSRDKIVIGRDRRKSSPKLRKAFVSGVNDLGVDIIDIGTVDTPILYFAVSFLNAEGGVMITASHNPLKINGIKMINKHSEFISGEEIKSTILEVSEKKQKNKGGVKKINIKKDYLKMVFKGFPSDQKIKIFYFLDYDGDRLTVKDENGQEIMGDILGGIIADSFVKKGDIVIYDLRCSHVIPEYFRNKGIMAIPSRAGRYNIKKLMEQKRAIFGMEITGHYFFREFHYCESPQYSLRKLMEYMKKTGKMIAELVKPFKKYSHSGIINLKTSEKKFDDIFEKLKENYRNGTQNYLDGLTIEFSNWWFNIRPSKTEPLIRLVIEAKNLEILKQKKKELFKLIKNAI